MHWCGWGSPSYFEQLHQVASLSLYGLCAALELSKDITDRASACVLHAFNEHTAIMWQRHVDQVIICAVYAGKHPSAYPRLLCIYLFDLGPPAFPLLYPELQLTPYVLPWQPRS